MNNLNQLKSAVRVIYHARLALEGTTAADRADERDLAWALLLQEDPATRVQLLQEYLLPLPPDALWQQASTLEPQKLESVLANPALKQLLKECEDGDQPCDKVGMLSAIAAHWHARMGEVPEALEAERTRKLLKVYHGGYILGQRYQSPGKSGYSDYEIGNQDKAFHIALETHQQAKHDLLMQAVNWNAKSPWGWIDRSMRQYGVLPTECLILFKLNANWPFASNKLNLSVRDLAWTFSPDYPPRILPELCAAMERLEQLQQVSPGCPFFQRERWDPAPWNPETLINYIGKSDFEPPW